ncbi:phospho-sugar mutase [Waddlia chondrophila]|uniref:Putative phosphoglucomutase/phosphomannomutase n=1 Tax=Waddlia chondrophila (strain ATCC VR-1470 / WSU 86-1044) TaxID=716544 RepID=D6YRR3_WADCW|nr:phospho-sugar mutase [Waddlia chondrophila]ADI38758.1 putative phosphoglucomutase/phosphomannomutase [Waddlia chondrophila WSU 86-1044]
MQIKTTTQKNLKTWLDADIAPEIKKELKRLIKEHPNEIEEGFYTRLTFGTGGLRAVMGLGTNRMNIYTVGMATQGLANYMKRVESKKRVFISYDCRNNSRLFAERTAKVLAGNGIEAILTKELRPTPYVSFGCRFLNCGAGVMITASHNPPEYNGYKVYWKDGGQVVAPHDAGIIQEVNRISSLDEVHAVEDLKHPFIKEVLKEVDTAYLDTIAAMQLTPDTNRKFGKQIHIVYSNLHGTGITLMPRAMERWGFTRVSTVEEQDAPDGSFPTARSPNPEEKKALESGLKKLKEVEGDLLIATDPDADRVGLAVRHQGKTHLLNGNQVACLLLNHICKAEKKLPDNAAFVKTIGTTELFRSIAEAHGGACIEVLTGFKYIAEKIEQWENTPQGMQFIFGGEESYGYLFGTHSHDKDAVISSTLIAEAALAAKLEGKTLIDQLHALWKTYGIHVEKLSTFTFPETKEGREKMESGMHKIKHSPPKTLNGIIVKTIENYQTSTKTNLSTGSKEPLSLPKSETLRLWLEDGSKVMVRPSGTEPKVKFYCGVKSDSFHSIDDGVAKLELHAQHLLDSLKNLF